MRRDSRGQLKKMSQARKHHQESRHLHKINTQQIIDNIELRKAG